MTDHCLKNITKVTLLLLIICACQVKYLTIKINSYERIIIFVGHPTRFLNILYEIWFFFPMVIINFSWDINI